MKYIVFILPIILLSDSSCKKNSTSNYPPLLVNTSEMTDSRDGHQYKTVTIGEQTWLAENLNYRTDSGSWYYENDSVSNAATYGRLYLWSAAVKGHPTTDDNPSNVQGISPPGWHIPSNSEWLDLQKCLKTFNATTNDLKMTGNAWGTNSTATNKAFFNAVPAGSIYGNGQFSYNIGTVAGFISTTLTTYSNGDSVMLGPFLDNNSTEFKVSTMGMKQGWSVRCIKDK